MTQSLSFHAISNLNSDLPNQRQRRSSFGHCVCVQLVVASELSVISPPNYPKKTRLLPFLPRLRNPRESHQRIVSSPRARKVDIFRMAAGTPHILREREPASCHRSVRRAYYERNFAAESAGDKN